MQQRVVRAAEYQHIRFVKAVSKAFLQINACDLFGYWMIHPSFFDQWNEQRTCFFMGLDPPRLQRFAVRMAADRSIGANHDNFALPALPRRTFRARLDHTEHRDLRRADDPVERQCRRGIASNHQKLRALRFQKLRRFDRVSGHCLNRLASIRQTRGVAKVQIVGSWNQMDELFKYGKSAKAGVEYANGGSSWSRGHAVLLMIRHEESWGAWGTIECKKPPQHAAENWTRIDLMSNAALANFLRQFGGRDLHANASATRSRRDRRTMRAGTRM